MFLVLFLFCSITSSIEGIAVVAGCLTKENNYFEVEIVNLGVNGMNICVIKNIYIIKNWVEGTQSSNMYEVHGITEIHYRKLFFGI